MAVYLPRVSVWTGVCSRVVSVAIVPCFYPGGKAPWVDCGCGQRGPMCYVVCCIHEWATTQVVAFCWDVAATHIDRMWCVGHDVGYNTRRRILRNVAATHIDRMWCVGHDVATTQVVAF